MSKKKSKDKKKKAKAATANGHRPASYLARVYVSLKPTVNDPEGNTISGALASLGFAGVEGVRSGRYFQVRIQADGRKEADAAVDQMCARLLANPVIETYSYELAPIG